MTARHVKIEMDDGSYVTADVGVLATGHEEAAPAAPELFISPWTRPANEGLDRSAPVLILGSGLTMVDFVLSLNANGHTGPIYAISRRGQLSEAHRPVMPLKVEPADIPFDRSIVELWRWLRDLTERTEAAGGDWRSAVDAVRPHTWQLWDRLPAEIEATLPSSCAALVGGSPPPILTGGRAKRSTLNGLRAS